MHPWYKMWCGLFSKLQRSSFAWSRSDEGEEGLGALRSYRSQWSKPGSSCPKNRTAGWIGCRPWWQNTASWSECFDPVGLRSGGDDCPRSWLGRRGGKKKKQRAYEETPKTTSWKRTDVHRNNKSVIQQTVYMYRLISKGSLSIAPQLKFQLALQRRFVREYIKHPGG